MAELGKKHCVRVRKSQPAVSREDVGRFLITVPDWHSDHLDGTNVIRRKFVLDDYTSARQFVDLVTQAAEVEDHHPQIIFCFEYVEIIYWTHVIDGLHMNDFIMAAKMDEIYDNFDR